MSIPLVDLKAQYEGIRREVDAAIQGVVASARFVGGPEVQAFETEFGEFMGGRGALGVSSGTSALHLCLLAAGVEPGDSVLLPSFTFIATAEVVRRCGATVRFLEIDPDTYCVDPALLESAWNERVKAVIPVHLYGHPADLEPITAWAKRRGVRVIEDAAQAHGARYRGKRCGSLAPYAAFSCYPGKNLGAYGDAGIVLAEDRDALDSMRRLSDHGRSDKYEHAAEGFNYRLDAIQAAVLRVKLRYLDRWNEARRRAASWYDERLRALPSVVRPRVAPEAEPVYHLYVIQVPERDRVLRALKEQGIDAGIHYPVPLHLQPAYRHLGYGPGDFPVTERIAERVLSLPMYPEITEDQVDAVVAALRRAL